MATQPVRIGDEARNPYFRFTDACNHGRARVILASGQACVWYRLAMASKDGDWIVRQDDADLDEVRRTLAAWGARYRLGAPLDARWLAAGWSSHFEAQVDGMRLRFDFVSRPPRIDRDRLDDLWREVDAGAPPVVRREDLILLKQTMRLKDYAFVGELALQCESWRSQVRWTLDGEHLGGLLAKVDDPRRLLAELRPGLAGAVTDSDALAMAIDAEVRDTRRRDERRMQAYIAAMEPWARRFRDLDTSTGTLDEVHARLIAAAAGVLPERVPQEIP